jgi:predicted lipoprotein with Yx(FWY)xxD motif
VTPASHPVLRRVLCGPVLLLALLAACGAPDQAAQESPAPPAHAQHEGHGGGEHGAGGHGAHGSGGASLWAVQTGPLGIVLTDGAGHLMYRSDADSAEPSTSTCTGACAETWIPMTVEPDQALDLAGVDDELVGRVQRPDGATQLTLAGWPLYRHRDDDGLLATTGQHGAEGSWFAVTPTGEKATPA